MRDQLKMTRTEFANALRYQRRQPRPAYPVPLRHHLCIIATFRTFGIYDLPEMQAHLKLLDDAKP